MGVAFGIAALLIFFLHLFRPKPKVVVLPSLIPLQGLSALGARRKNMRRPKRLLALFVAWSVALSLALGMAKPEFVSETPSPSLVVFLLDASASMQATIKNQAISRFDWAKAEIASAIRGLSPSSRSALVLAKAHPILLAHPGLDPESTLNTLNRAQGTDGTANIEEAIDLAKALCTKAPSCAIEVYTDHPFATPNTNSGAKPETIHIHHLGEPMDNIAITAFGARRSISNPREANLIVEIQSFASQDASIDLLILERGLLRWKDTFTIGSGKRVRRLITLSAPDATFFESRITFHDRSSPIDALGIDNRSFTAIPPRRTRKVLHVSPPEEANFFVDAVLQVDTNIEVVSISPEQYLNITHPPSFDIILFDRYLPPSPPTIPWVAIHPCHSPQPWFACDHPLESPRFAFVDRTHPLLAHLALHEVNIARAHPPSLESSDQILGADPKGALLVSGIRAGQRFWVIGFDVRESDLPMRAAWPLLIHGAIELLAPDPLQQSLSFRAGEDFRIPFNSEIVTLRQLPDSPKTTLTTHHGILSLRLDHSGIYELLSPSQTMLFSIQTDERESNLKSALPSPPPSSPPKSTPSQPPSFFPLWLILLLASALLLLVSIWIDRLEARR
ncbi:MAG: VWA domain-containing protein [Sandaracinaceae bacterium]|nr:VWA domain-containing protein [Sandaracinaceae bacterium]